MKRFQIRCLTRRGAAALAVAAGLFAAPALGQTDDAADVETAATTETDTTEPSEDATQTRIEEAPFLSPRAAGMGGALSPLADDLDAAFHNPAGIGGLGWGKTKPPYVRKLWFPHVGIGANENSAKLYKSSKRRAPPPTAPSGRR
jgi:hypothetical protein